MQYSAAHNVCVYDTPNPERIASLVPAARLLTPEKIAVPCELHNMQIMRYLGYQAYSPMLQHYDWPIAPDRNGNPRKPFDHQRATSAFLTLHPRCFLLNDIGTGKTLSVLWALDYLMRLGFVKKALILSPLSTLETVWFNEIYGNFLSRAKAVLVYGSREKRMRQLNQEAQYYIINHDGLGVGSERANKQIKLGELARFVRDNPDFNAIVVDEGSTYKDSGTFRYKVLKQVISDKPYVWWLTGTIAPKEPVDAWAQARVVRKDYQESQKNFKERSMYRVSTFKWLPRKNAAQTTAEIIQPAIRFKREECIDLPPFMTVDRDVELSPNQKKAYDDLKRQLRIMMKEGSVTAVNEAALRNKLIQISCGAVYGEQHQVNKLDCSPRLAVMREVIEQCDGKFLIFAPLTSVVNLLYDDLKADYSIEVINGSVSAARRAEIFRDFQNNPNPQGIIADPGTMAHGITLTAAATIIWYGPTDKPEIYIQANGRINRPGQTRSMLAVRLAATPIEREIYRRLDGRHNLQGMMLDIIRGEDDGH